MKHTLLYIGLLLMSLTVNAQRQANTWPDGTPMSSWFSDSVRVDTRQLGRRYVVTDYGVQADSTLVQTTALQQVIDRAAAAGGGVVVVPRGTFVSGALFFRQGTHLLLEQGACLKGSDRISDFPVLTTRIEGETCTYFAALVNVDRNDGFTLSGPGIIDGNGRHYWQEFWIRRSWNPQCTNKDAQRPRLLYIAHSKNVTLQDVRLQNSPFWTCHLYQCQRVRLLGCSIFAPTENVWAPEPQRGAPSSDAVDIDVCTDVLISGCYMHVSDDAVVLKGGKGTYADLDTTNGANERILVEHCRYGRVYACLTLGSESLYNHNIVLRHCHSERADRVLWLKMRPDTPQHYEYVSVSDVSGRAGTLLFIHPWTQFYRAEERADMPRSRCNDVSFSRCTVTCQKELDVVCSDKYDLLRFTQDGRLLSFQ